LLSTHSRAVCTLRVICMACGIVVTGTPPTPGLDVIVIGTPPTPDLDVVTLLVTEVLVIEAPS